MKTMQKNNLPIGVNKVNQTIGISTPGCPKFPKLLLQMFDQRLACLNILYAKLPDRLFDIHLVVFGELPRELYNRAEAIFLPVEGYFPRKCLIQAF